MKNQQIFSPPARWPPPLVSHQIGTKCLVKLDDMPGHLLQCHVRDIDAERNSCVVFVEKFAEKRSVPVERLHLLTATDSPRRHARYTSVHDKGLLDACESEKQCDHYSEHRHHRHKSCADRSPSKYSFSSDYDDSCCDSAAYKPCDLEAYTNLANFQPLAPIQLIALPIQFQSPNMTTTSNILPANNAKPPKGRQQMQGQVTVGASAPKMAAQMPASQVAIAPPPQMGVGPACIEKAGMAGKRDDGAMPPKSGADPKADAQPANQGGPETMVDPNMAPAGQPQYLYVPNAPAMVPYTYAPPVAEYAEPSYYGAPAEVASGYYTAPPSVYQQQALPPPNFATFSPNQVYPVPVSAWSGFNSPIGHHQG